MSSNVSERELEIFKVLMQRYKTQWDMNSKTRENYDEDLEFYLGYRNASEFPLAFNESFNMILPIIYTILSRFMDQMFQSGNVVAVKPRRSENLESSKAVEAVLNFQMENLNSIDMSGGAYLTMYKWFFNCLTFGKGILKTYWRKEERISPIRTPVPVPAFDRRGGFQGWETVDHITMQPQIIYDGPYCEVLHNKTFIPHPEYKSIQQMPAVFVVYKRSLDYVRSMVEKGVYRAEALEGIGWESAGGAGTEPRDSCEAYSKSLAIEGYQTFGDSAMQDDLISKEIDILECYTKLILEDEPYEVGSGYKIKGREEEVIVHIGNYKRILSIQRNVYGHRPLFDIGAYLQPELFWDVGLVRLTKGIQRQRDNLANLRMQDIMMKISTMLRVDPNWDGNADELVWRPFGLVEAAQGDIEPIVMPDLQSQIFVEQEGFFKSAIQDLMGMYDYNMGATPERQERVGVVYGIQSMGEARAKLMLMTIDYMGIRPLLKYMMLLNTFHLPNGYEYRISQGSQNKFGKIFAGDIHSDFDFSARYTAMEPALGKAARLQQLMNLSQIMLQNPWINQYQWWRTIFELGDIREADYLLKTPQQYAQEQQAMQQSQMQMAQMQLMAEKAKMGWETEKDVFTSHKDFREDTALAEQKFKHEMALTMVEGDIKDEQAKSAKRAAKAA